MANLELLRSGGGEAAAAIALAAAEAEADDVGYLHGNLVHCAALGQSHHISDHAPHSSMNLRLQALSVAAITGRAGVVRALCDAKADPTSMLPDGFHHHATALHLAVLHGQCLSTSPPPPPPLPRHGVLFHKRL